MHLSWKSYGQGTLTSARHEDMNCISQILLPTIKCSVIIERPDEDLAGPCIYAVLWPHPEWQVSLTAHSGLPQVDTCRVNHLPSSDFCIATFGVLYILYGFFLTRSQNHWVSHTIVKLSGDYKPYQESVWYVLQDGHWIVRVLQKQNQWGRQAEIYF